MKKHPGKLLVVGILAAGALMFFAVRHNAEPELAARDTEVARLHQEIECPHAQSRENARRSEQRQNAFAGSATTLAAEKSSAQASTVDAEGDPFLNRVHNLVDGAGAIYEKFQQTPGAMIPELALLEKSDWMALARDYPDLSSPEAVQKALSQTRVRAKNNLLSQTAFACRAFRHRNPHQQLVHPQQLVPFFRKPETAALLSRYTMPPREQWAAILADYPGEQIPKHPVEFVIREKSLPPGALEKPAVLFGGADEICWSANSGRMSSLIDRSSPHP